MTVLCLLGLSAAQAAPRAELWERWVPRVGAVGHVDHTAWDAFLKRHVIAGEDGVNRIAYGAVDNGARAGLDAYLEMLRRVDPVSLSRDEAMAFWINLYNALTVQVVLAHFPVESIRDIDISPGLFADGPWGAKLIGIGGEELSLDDIEHRILRPIWRDARVHYAVNCASIGCPNLRARAWTAKGLDGQLDAAARAFVNHTRAVTVRDGEAVVSSIYDWFADDFGGTEAAVLDHIREFADPALRVRLTGVGRIGGDRYDWRLNDAAVAR